MSFRKASSSISLFQGIDRYLEKQQFRLKDSVTAKRTLAVYISRSLIFSEKDCEVCKRNIFCCNQPCMFIDIFMGAE